ncbi:hypothetical protein [Micromonospora musae]|uniref:Uncharacterized protein n=1 Tax=Micromonospora musae TaxID=1894970 RepID=A0A3A9Y1Y2_9ACTN|nr:hypothetical protein [Micromonospora musae]RKN25566.1 hypothetical protein D7044_31310 [Micromonospora musae]
MRKALATVFCVGFLGLLTAGGLALVWFPVQEIINFEPQRNLVCCSPLSDAPVSADEQRNDLIINSLFPIGGGIGTFVLAIYCLKHFISYLRE